jgi:hypothetical protein
MWTLRAQMPDRWCQLRQNQAIVLIMRDTDTPLDRKCRPILNWAQR